MSKSEKIHLAITPESLPPSVRGLIILLLAAQRHCEQGALGKRKPQ